MDANIVLLCGRVAAPPEVVRFESGGSRARLLIAVRSEVPSPRLDLIPIVQWRPPATVLDLRPDDRIWAIGSVQRRFWDEPEEGRGSSVQVVAHQIDLKPLQDELLI